MARMLRCLTLTVLRAGIDCQSDGKEFVLFDTNAPCKP
mgnify:CR=1 FL=1